MPVVMPVPVNTAITQVGPLYQPKEKGKNRDKYEHRKNETMSLSDRVHEEVTEIIAPQVPAGALCFHDVANKKLYVPSLNQTIPMTIPLRELVLKYREMVVDHVERRTAVFLQQLIVCYKTTLHFEQGKVMDQAESSKTLYYIDPFGEKKELSRRMSAHSSTLPCLIAYNGAEWKNHIENNAPMPQAFTYIMGSDIYRTANSTLEMPHEVNDADIDIDGKNSTSGKLRSKALALLNRASSGDIDPVEGIKLFLRDAIRITHREIPKEQREGVKAALEIFEVVFREIRDNLDDDATTLDQLLGVKMDPTNEEDRIRKKVYQLRYKAIRDNHYAQSAMLEKIKAVSESVLKKTSTKGKYSYYDDAFRAVLMEELGNDIDRQRVSKLLNSPQDSYFKKRVFTPQNLPKGSFFRINSVRMTKFNTAKTKIEKEIGQIQVLARDLRQQFRAMKNEERANRGEINRILRNMKGLTQKTLGREIKKINPRLPASQPSISRMENNIKPITGVYVSALSQIFKVDPVLFVPKFFND